MSEENKTPETVTLSSSSAGETIAKLQPLADEVGDSIALGKKVAAQAKKDGWKKAATDNASEIVKEVKEDIAAVKAALPSIKAGYKTTEFWLVAGLLLANTAVFAIRGEALPFNINATVGALVGVYTVIRGAIKAKG